MTECILIIIIALFMIAVLIERAENARLKEEIAELNFYIDSYKQVWEVTKYKDTLSKIKEIAEKGLDKHHNGLIIAKPILDLITKAESEG